MKKFKIWSSLRNLIEIGIPFVTFCLMFILFIVQIFFRYILRNPLSWTMEAISILFLWTCLFGACYAFRTDQHIRFSLLYDKLPRKWGEITSLVGNFIVVILMILSFAPTVKYVDYMAIQSSSVMRISFRIIYAPYILFLGISIVYTIVEMINQFKFVLGNGKEKGK